MGNSTLLAIFFSVFLGAASANAQAISPAHRLADRLSQEMGASLSLHEDAFIKVRQFNRDRLAKLQALNGQAGKLSAREMDLRLDQIEQEYNERMFHLLNARQYMSYKRFRENRLEFTRPSQALASARR
ncbi:hypothetical protein [Rufibacter sp. LB8]|uniref:hypothetical protein n=1 Tax=Rufibacter sp. LB8 TaxID=2777781 RepID=UPI00178C5E59|nr:hypothetical protein [Rufibacter sp. LB8]